MALLAVAARTCALNSIRRWKSVCLPASCYRSRRASMHSGVQASSEPVADTQFKVFYRFPYIVGARFISRLKIYQTALTVVAVPPTLYYYSIGAIDPTGCLAIISISAFALTMLYVFAYFFQRVVGLAALSGDGKLVRLSHLTFFGRRNDVLIPVDEIVPLTDVSETRSDVFVKIRRYTTSDVLFMSLTYGIVEDAPTFIRVFGSVE